MSDRDPFELVEMSPGAQPPSGFGDRMLVGLALIALLSGVLIAVVNALPDTGEAAQASVAPSSTRTRTPRPIPTPEPPRVANVQEPDIELAQPQQPYSFGGWIRASADLVIRSSPEPDAVEVGVLKKGEIAYASQQGQSSDEPGWLFLEEAQQGWVATIAGGEELARRYEYPRYQGSGWIDRITAGPDGFVAMLTPPGGPDVYPPSRPVISADGVSWPSAGSSSFGEWYVQSVAWGPAGWLAAATVSDDTQQRIWIWSSPDGLHWSRRGMLAGVNQEYVLQLLASDAGYLLETQPESGTYSSVTTLWSSADGQTWNESIDPILKNAIYGGRRIAALAAGFYLWDPDLVAPRSFTAFSVDGNRWFEVEDGPDGVNMQITDVQDRIVAIDHDRTTLAPRTWSGSFADGRLHWLRQAEGDQAFAGGVVAQVVSDGRRVFAFGWDRTTEEPLVWTGSAAGWVRASLPESFGGLPLVAAAGPGGVVVVGHRHSLRGDNPIVWHRTANGRWLPEPDPMMAAVPDPSTDECPELPTEYMEFTVMDSAAVISCYGAAPITFQAFSIPCEGCSGSPEGNPEPAWLLDTSLNALYLSPSPTDSGWSSSVVLAPTLEPDAAWTDAWIEVTGHLDDPAASTCHLEPTAEMLSYWTGQQSLIDQCRQTFVVTSVTVVTAP